MSVEGIAGAAFAQKQALVQQEVGVRVFRMALDSQASQALSLIQMMNQSAGVGTSIDTSA
jgi:hypothetical protein